MNRLLPLIFALAGLVLALSPAVARAQAHADTILVDGKVWTGNPGQPEAEAIAILDGKVAAVGNDIEVRSWAGPATEVLELRGRRVVPGFNDAHVHFFDGGQGLASVQLRDAPSPQVFRDRIGAYATTLDKGRWVLNGNWDHERWTPADLPTRQLIDAVTPDNPVFINRLDGHMALANSLALELAGITRDTPDPPGGSIVRDADGEPTGVLKDAAMNAVYAVIPEASPAEIAIALRAAMREANENGVTSVQDMSAPPDILRAYRQLLADGEHTGPLHPRPPRPAGRQHRARRGRRADRRAQGRGDERGVRRDPGGQPGRDRHRTARRDARGQRERRDQRAGHVGLARHPACVPTTACRWRTHRARVRRAAAVALGTAGRAGHRRRLRQRHAAHRRAQGLRRRVAGLDYGAVLRTLSRRTWNQRPAQRGSGGPGGDARRHGRCRRRRPAARGARDRRQGQRDGAGHVHRSRAPQRSARPAPAHRARPAPAPRGHRALPRPARHRLDAALPRHR